jgi:hypothetical protein
MVKKYPFANIGISTGAVSKTAVVDVGDQPAWDMLHEMLPGYDFKSVPPAKSRQRIWLALSFQSSRHTDQERALSFAPGMDSRGDGGYIMAGPSVHVSGRRYEWRYLPPVENSRYFPRS